MNPGYGEITAAAVREKLESGRPVRVVDVRERWEYDRRHIPEALLMPMGEFADRCRTELSPTEEVVLICEHGVRSQSAAQYLVSLGYEQVTSMTGGMAAYDGVVEGAQ